MPNTHTTLTSLFDDIADAIRAKTGSAATIVADNFPTEIAAIPSGGSPISGSYTMPNETYQTFSIDVGEAFDVFVMAIDTPVSGQPRGIFCINRANDSRGYYMGILTANGGVTTNPERMTLTGNVITVARAATFVAGSYSWVAYKSS